MTPTARLGLLLAAAALLAPPGLRAHDRTGFSMSVLVDGVPAPEYSGRGHVYIEALQGREFVIQLSNPTSERVAVALSVDGRNVVDAKRTSSLVAAKWILGPGQTVDIPGWQVSGTTSRKFFFTETAKSYARWLGDTSNVGTIEAVFYREKVRPPVSAWKDENAQRKRAEAPAPGPSAEAGASRDSSAAAKVQEAENFAATGIGEKTDFAVRWVAFEEDPAPAASIALRYEFRPELIRLGLLSRENDLYARDRARGFEHDYAPDPYGQRR